MQVLKVPWTAKGTNEWVLGIASLIVSGKSACICERKETGIPILRAHADKERRLLGVENNTRYNSSSCTRGRPKMTWIDNIKWWTGLSLTELVRNVKDRHR